VAGRLACAAHQSFRNGGSIITYDTSASPLEAIAAARCWLRAAPDCLTECDSCPTYAKPASDASIRIECVIRHARPFGSSRPSQRFHTPVTVFVAKSARTPVASTGCATFTQLGELVPCAISVWPVKYWPRKSGTVAQLAALWIWSRVVYQSLYSMAFARRRRGVVSAGVGGPPGPGGAGAAQGNTPPPAAPPP